MADDRGHLIERAAERMLAQGTGGAGGLRAALGRAAPATPPLARAPGLPLVIPGPSQNVPPEDEHGMTQTLARPPARTEAAPGPFAEPDVDGAALTRAGMINWSAGRTRVTEEFRVAQAQVLRGAFPPGLGTAKDDAPPSIAAMRGNLVMVTSARPGEGKSFSSLNLAVGIARQRDRDVLLVDVDAKSDSLGALLGTLGAPGLLDLVSDPAREPETLLRTTAIDRLSFLPIGSVGAQRAELASSRQMARVIGDLGRRYADRLVIIDAPPVLASSEPAALASVVGQVIFVIAAEETQRGEIEAALDLIAACPSIALLLNKVQLRTRQSFGGYTSSYRYAAS